MRKLSSFRSGFSFVALVVPGALLASITPSCSSELSIGDACAPDDTCPEGTRCAAGADGESQCLIPAGGACDVEADETYCAGGTRCEGTAESAQCRIVEGGACDPAIDDPYCAGGNVCAELEAGGHACFPPVVVEGRVFDASSNAGVVGAQLLALDDQATPLTDVATSVADGAYELEVPVARKQDGAPAKRLVTLRASAQKYQTFPSGSRTALPITTDTAVLTDGRYLIETALTDVSLVPLPASEQVAGSITGTILAGDRSGGVLVAAEGGAAGARTAISDKHGGYTIFNVPDGAYTVSGYAAGVALDQKPVNVSAAPVSGVDLSATNDALGVVSGSVNIVNAPGGSATSVVLVLESTFSETFVRGEVPRGLRTPLSGPPTVSGAFSITDVPPGRYVALAGFENDDLVRDPDPNIGGTQIVHVEMTRPGRTIALDSSFKVTEALAVLGPGATDPEPVTAAPTLRWADDSSEDHYGVVVFDAFGNKVWEDAMVPRVTGGGDVSVVYGGPLDKGMYYQFRATSFKGAGPISQTEDLRGVFFVP